MSKVDLKGRDFLKLLDYTPEEILYLVDLAAEYKEMKKKGKLHDSLHGKNVALIFEKHPQEHDVLLRWQRMILVWEQPIWTRQAPRSARKKALRIRQGCLQVCMTE